MTRRAYAFGLLVALLALAVAGCGGSDSSTTSGGAGSTEASPEAGGTSLAIATISGPGAVLVDSEERTVYEFAKDQGTTSSCYGPCAEAWPPVLTGGEPIAGEGASASELGTTERKDGTTQVTYAGHPLYTFIEDKAPGEANGNGSDAFGGKWWALDESGAMVEDAAGGEGEAAESEAGGMGGYSGY